MPRTHFFLLDVPDHQGSRRDQFWESRISHSAAISTTELNFVTKDAHDEFCPPFDFTSASVEDYGRTVPN